ncbi:recombinase family protein [Sporosarcina sp. 179-K 3D1 HS]|uniref:recombinase family protein n=1 Tax=Sporosarcina sp. 179-K 3D1 HS TaxID=3232169 RepID=UPI00399FD840
MKKRAVLYTRVSTNKEEQELSLKNQESYYEEWCKKNNYELVDIYAEKGLSGTNARRPEFIKMLVDAGLNYIKKDNSYDWFEKSDREPKFDLIITKDISRFSRSGTLGISVIEYLRDIGVYINFENNGLVTDSEEWYTRTNLLLIFAQSESENTSRRIKFTKKYNADKGKYSPARLPYGYKRDTDNKIVVDDEQRKIVEKIFNEFMEAGSKLLTQRLNEMNIPTQQGNKWSGDKILRIIKNKIYTGTAVVNRTTKKNVTDTKRQALHEDEWIEIPNAVPPIIEVEMWEQANKIRESRINKSTKKGRKPAVNDIYYGKLYCEKCGSRFVRHIGAKEKTTYICWNRRNGQGCDVRGISISNVNEAFDRIGVSSLIDGIANYTGYTRLMERIEAETANLNNRRNEVTVKIEQLEIENNTIKQAIKQQLAGGTQGVIDMFVADIEKNIEQIKEHESQIEKINIDSISKLREKVEQKRVLIEEIHSGTRIKKAEKLKLLKEIVVGDYEIKVSFSFPNYEEEILEFNSLFPMAEIHSVTFHKFEEHFRRTHKEAREFWQGVDDSKIDFYNHPNYYNVDGNYFIESGGTYFVSGKNLSKEAIEAERLLEESSKN